MKEYKFYGHETAGGPKPLTDDLDWLHSPIDLYDALADGLWRRETCAPRMQDEWTPENMTLGQCSITAFIVQDLFGGEVYGILRPGGNYHCYNVIGDAKFDLTSEQFGEEAKDLVYDDVNLQTREVHFEKEEKKARYEYLKQLVYDYRK
ncbi:MAG: hypothetical protein J5776_07535 [Clostridiales bacterium]|nr:hypothetical protein [Clostridiales bacterium]